MFTRFILRMSFFHFYNQTGDLCMTLQHGVEFEEYFRCYVVGQEKVHIMRYDPKAPFHERYVKGKSCAGSGNERESGERRDRALPGFGVRPQHRRVRGGGWSTLPRLTS